MSLVPLLPNQEQLKQTETTTPKPGTWSRLFLELLTKRGISAGEMSSFLFPDLSQLSDPYLMKGMKEAVLRIRQAVEKKETMMLHGDYDVDGITAAAILGKTLEILGANFETFLPNRSLDGYGVSARAIREAAKRGITLLITADCGITAHTAIREARSLGVDVIIIDHHQIPSAGLPEANVILNPFQEGCEYPFQGLSAGGLAFKLAQALQGEEAVKLLDLAALSTVCDVAPLISENRILVKKGLEVLGSRQTPGIKALTEVASIKGPVNVGHVGFALGPRINAAGRMSSPEIALRLLMTHHEKEAQSLAKVLDEENKIRQREEHQVTKEAMTEVERTMNFNREKVIVVAREGWHQGVIGIVASRLVDRYHRPAIVIGLDQGEGKGSGRSIKDFPLHLALRACHEDLVEHGGHAQAAGLKIRAGKVSDFKKHINEFAQDLDPEMFKKRYSFDLAAELSDFHSIFMQELKLLEPHGMENPRPVFFTSGLTIKNAPQKIGLQALKFWVTDGSTTAEAIWSERSDPEDQAWIRSNQRIEMFYTVKTKVWDGIESLVLEVKKLKPQL